MHVMLLACVLLLLLTAWGVATHPWLVAWIAPLVIALLAADIERHGGRTAERLVRAAALLVPTHERDDQRAEWIDHVRSAGEKGIRPVACALSIAFIAAPLVAVLARYDARRRRATR
jgi:hypothetical protein